jgi:hypothetical protein
VEPDQIPPGDVVAMLANCHTPVAVREAAAHVAHGVTALAAGSRVIVVHADEATGAEAMSAAPANGGPMLWLHPFGAVERVPVITSSTVNPYRVLFATAERAGARAALMLGSNGSVLSTAMVESLLRPLLTSDLDLAAPRYRRHKFEGLINSAIVYPLTRALFGRRIQGQIGVDYGFSGRLVSRLLSSEGATRPGRTSWIPAQAVAEDLQACEVSLAASLPPAEGAEPSQALAQVLGPLFLEIERQAAFWQRVARTQAVPLFGDDVPAGDDSGPFDVKPLVESFQLAYRNLQDVWALVLPPATLLELKRLTLLAPDSFRFPDDLWARVVYDFALAHRVRAINRDHLLRALTPAYLAWVASYALQVREMSWFAVTDRIERLCQSYESQKPYFLRRWRWPDRFNP